MKKVLLVACVVILSIVNSSAQEQEVCIPWNKITIPIYANQLTDSIVHTIYQDYDAEDHIYEVFIKEKSPLRFRIEYRDLYDNTNKIRSGWIDKKYCGVYDRWYYDDQQQGYIKLYTLPDVKSEFIKIYQTPVRAMTVIGYQEDFIEVMFDIEGTVYTGWVDRYCRNIFNSCT